MKRTLFATAFILGIISAIAGTAYAQNTAAGISSYSPFKLLSGIIQPQSSAWTLRVPSLSSSGNCVVTDVDGDFSTSACSGGGGGSSSDKWATTSPDTRFIQPNSALGIIVGLSTTTSATSTNFFSTNASTTNATSTNVYTNKLTVNSTTYPQFTLQYPGTTACTVGETANGLGVLAGCTKWGIVEVLPGSSLAVFGNAAIGSTNEFSRGVAPTGGLIVGGQTGIGTSSPWGTLSVSSANNTTARPLFIIASSSAAVSTTTPFIVSNTGLVGIGTNVPAFNLQVNGTGVRSVASANVVYTQEDPQLTVVDDDNNSKMRIGYDGTLNAGFLQPVTPGCCNRNLLLAPGGGNVGVGSTTPWAQLSINPNGITDPAFAIGSSTATILVVTNGGNVGIDTAAPGEKLDVVGAIRASGAGTSNLANSIGISMNGTRAILGAWGTNSATRGIMDFTVFTSSGGFPFVAMTIDSNGNVGIASTTPFANFAINPTAGAASNQFVVGSSTRTSFIIDNQGRVGIATTTPSATFSVHGNTIISGTTFLGATTTSTSTGGYLGTISALRNLTFQTGTTTTWTGTTSGAYISRTIAPFSGTIRNAICLTDVGTVGVAISHTSTNLNYIPTASTTANTFVFTSNNTFTKGEPIYFSAGTPVSSPTTVSCTLGVTETP